MVETSAGLFTLMAKSYGLADGTDRRGVHENFSALDFELRFLAVLANSVLRASEDAAAPEIGRAPGLGEWLTYLRRCAHPLVRVPGEAAAAVRAAVDDVLRAYDGGLGSSRDEFRAPKALRDHLSHGGALPQDESIGAALDGLIRRIYNAIEPALALSSLSCVEDRNGQVRAVLTWGNCAVPLWPLVYGSSDGAWHLFSRASQGSPPTYLSYGGSRVRTSNVPEVLRRALDRVVTAPRLQGPLNAFQKDVRQDLMGFAEEDETKTAAYEHGEGFEILWSKATGTGSGFEVRRDYFRLGPDDVRQWRSDSGWIAYSQYLRELANWNVVAKRIRQSLEKLEAELEEQERDTLGWSARSAYIRDAQVVVSDMDGSDPQGCSFSDLISGVDDDLQANRGLTQVVFLNGEAGIGKTRAMLAASTKRARTIEDALGQGQASDLPLFLYVRSTGQVLDNLKTVIEGAVASTRNLTDAGVKTLCRNGLMAILIDGFDELLGNVRYSDALGSLRPWLNELGGRGVIVVSARSSYYVGQYRASVQQAQDDGLPMVRHRIAEIQRWSEAETESLLKEFDLDPEILRGLAREDRKLLGLPFFSRVFIELCLKSTHGLPEITSLPEQLLDQYVAREERKLLGIGRTSLLSRAELMDLFCYLAELMDEQSEREADEPLLRLAAEFTIGESLDEREGLVERLPTLCGLAATKGSQSLRFRFQHELFFDQFLAGAASSHLTDGSFPRFHAMLACSVWRSATLARVVSLAGSGQVIDALTAYGANRGTWSTTERRILATNAGALWSEAIQTNGAMGYDVRLATFSEGLDLSETSPGELVLTACDVASVTLPAQPGWQIHLRDTTLRKIVVLRTTDLVGLRGVRAGDVKELLTPGMLLDRQDDIVAELVRLGADVAGVKQKDEELPPESVIAAEAFLERMIRRLDYFLVLKRNHSPADKQSLKWTQDYGPDHWQTFIRLLLKAGLADEDAMVGAGSAKVKVRLTRNAQEILDRSPDDHRITTFWASFG